jgi:hypothetical protein
MYDIIKLTDTDTEVNAMNNVILNIAAVNMEYKPIYTDGQSDPSDWKVATANTVINLYNVRQITWKIIKMGTNPTVPAWGFAYNY